MSTPSRSFPKNTIFHIMNRGVEKRSIFVDKTDYRRFLKTLVYYQQVNRSTRFSLAEFDIKNRQAPFRFDLITYCLMPNHFHLLVRETADEGQGIPKAMAQLLNSYTKYFNIRRDRVGPLFQGTFKAVPVDTDEQLIHSARYILLNPFVGGLTDNLATFPWSAYQEYFDHSFIKICQPSLLDQYFPSRAAMKKFVDDYRDLARTIEQLQKAILE